MRYIGADYFLANSVFLALLNSSNKAQPMNDSLDNIDDEEFAKDLHEKVKAKNFAAGVPIFYQEDKDDVREPDKILSPKAAMAGGLLVASSNSP